MRLILAIVAALICCSATPACATDHEVVLGTTSALSGPNAVVGTEVVRGMQMRVDEANDSGGVNGSKIRFIALDNQSDPRKAVQDVRRLVEEDKVVAIVAPCCFGSAFAAASAARNTLWLFPYMPDFAAMADKNPSPLRFGFTSNDVPFLGPTRHPLRPPQRPIRPRPLPRLAIGIALDSLRNQQRPQCLATRQCRCFLMHSATPAQIRP